MKKQLLLTILFTGFASILFAQIPNASFEDWTGALPNHWWTTTDSPYVVQSTNAHAGSIGAKLRVVNFSGVVNVGGIMDLGDAGQGYHTSTAPEAIHGWYILNSVGGDYIQVVTGMIKSSPAQGTGAGVTEIQSATNTYKEFIANIQYITTNGTPDGDSLLLSLQFIGGENSGAMFHAGSYFIVDDLSFGAKGTTGINETNVYTADIESVSPNPANDNAKVIFTVTKPATVNISVYDITGKLVLVPYNEKLTQGRYKTNLDVSQLAAGTYICRMASDDVTVNKKLIVVR